MNFFRQMYASDLPSKLHRKHLQIFTDLANKYS